MLTNPKPFRILFFIQTQNINKIIFVKKAKNSSEVKNKIIKDKIVLHCPFHYYLQKPDFT